MNSSASVDAKRFRESLHILINRDQSKSAVVERWKFRPSVMVMVVFLMIKFCNCQHSSAKIRIVLCKLINSSCISYPLFFYTLLTMRNGLLVMHEFGFVINITMYYIPRSRIQTHSFNTVPLLYQLLVHLIIDS